MVCPSAVPGMVFIYSLQMLSSRAVGKEVEDGLISVRVPALTLAQFFRYDSQCEVPFGNPRAGLLRVQHLY